MARVVLVALVCAVSAEDYGGFGVPQYAGGGVGDYAAAAQEPAAALEDYRGHSPDAPAPLDYKYQEEPPGNTGKLTKGNEEDTWNKPIRKRRKFSRHRKDLPPDYDDINNAPKVRSERVEPRRRSRVPSERLRTRERGARHRRERYEHSVDDDASHQYLDKDYFRNDKENIIDDDIDTFTRRETTERTVRRKPRDRSHHKLPKRGETDMDGELEPNRRVIEKKEQTDYEENRGGVVGGADEIKERRRPMLPEEDDADQFIEELSGRYKSKSYPDYTMYDDTRRFQNIKDKMPLLLRRTTTMRILVNEPTHVPAPKSSPSTSDLLPLLWTARRSGQGRPPEPTEAPLTTARDTDALPTRDVATTIPSWISSDTTEELSIAEKSRLSILKKAQKKEKIRDNVSKKPPVLLQVTSNLPTMVMVEPPTSGNPWKGARLVSGDSPGKLDRVKRLMRSKLVAGAKSIQDLTDNWDEMVCDYIDVSLLDSATRNELVKVLVCVNIVLLFLVR